MWTRIHLLGSVVDLVRVEFSLPNTGEEISHHLSVKLLLKGGMFYWPV